MDRQEVNRLWQSCLAHRAVIRKSMIEYAVQMQIDESEDWRNPFRKHLDSYDDSLLSLMEYLTRNCIVATMSEYAPNINVDIDTVLSGMVDALTDEDSETTLYDKPLVFDAEWIDGYLQKNYLSAKSDVAYRQLLSDVYHLIGRYYIEKSGRDGIEKNGVITIPFYADKWFRGEHRITEGTYNLMNKFDKLVQVVVSGADASTVEASIFGETIGSWRWAKDGPSSKELFKKITIDADGSPIDWFRPVMTRSEVDIHFKNAEDAKKIIDAILHPHK